MIALPLGIAPTAPAVATPATTPTPTSSPSDSHAEHGQHPERVPEAPKKTADPAESHPVEDDAAHGDGGHDDGGHGVVVATPDEEVRTVVLAGFGVANLLVMAVAGVLRLNGHGAAARKRAKQAARSARAGQVETQGHDV